MIIMNKLRLFLVSILSLAVLFGLASPLVLAADCTGTTAKDAIQCGANGASGDSTQSSQASATSLSAIIGDVLNILSVIVGIIAVIMIIVGGFRYITSGGASDKVTSAKNTLLYAIVGLIVVALAQIIVQFVLNKATNGPSTSSSSSSNSTSVTPFTAQ